MSVGRALDKTTGGSPTRCSRAATAASSARANASGSKTSKPQRHLRQRPPRARAHARRRRPRDGRESCFVFLSGEVEPEGAPRPSSHSGPPHAAHSTVRLKAEEALYLRPPDARALGRRGDDGRIVRELALLVRVSTRSTPCARRRSYARAAPPRLRAVPAERGAILLVGETAASSRVRPRPRGGRRASVR